VASFGIVSRLESIATMPIFAFSMSLTTLVGMFYGAREYTALKEIVWYGIKVGVLVTSGFGLLFFIVPGLFLRIFTPDPILLAISAQYLRIDVFTFPLMAVTMSIARVMQGLGRGMPGLIITMIRIFFGAIPLAALFVYVLDYSFIWIAVAMVAGGILSSITGLLWIRHTFKKLHIQG
jgi:Na+-driven multidrug efflux pump